MSRLLALQGLERAAQWKRSQRRQRQDSKGPQSSYHGHWTSTFYPLNMAERKKER